jgi:hypothetical protein
MHLKKETKNTQVLSLKTLLEQELAQKALEFSQMLSEEKVT